jgi:hypothetical protein
MSKSRFLAILLLVVGVVPGCYTQLQQPPSDLYSDRTSDWDERYAPPGFSLYDDWTYPYYTSLYGPAAWTWGPYYYHPVWWGDPWGPPHPPHGGPAPTTPVETGGRHGWGRGPGSPYVPILGGGGGVPATPTKDGQPATTPTNPTPSTPSTPTQPDRTKTPDNADKKEEPKRHGWGR